MTKIRRIEDERTFRHYAHRSMAAVESLRCAYGKTWPWREALAGLAYVLSAEDPRVAAYCTDAREASLPWRTADESAMDCMEFCSRRVQELMALQALENLASSTNTSPRCGVPAPCWASATKRP